VPTGAFTVDFEGPIVVLRRLGTAAGELLCAVLGTAGLGPPQRSYRHYGLRVASRIWGVQNPVRPGARRTRL